MNILYIAPTDPRKTSYGGQQRTHVIWEGLKSIPGAKVTTFVPVQHKSLELLDESENVFCLCFEKRNSIGWLAQRLILRIIPYWNCSWAYDWRALHRRFRNVDAVVVRYAGCAVAFEAWKLAPIYLDADDIHTVEYDQQTRELGNSLWRRFVRFILGRWQFGVYRRARRVWIPAAEHLPLLAGYPAASFPNIPCGEKPDYSQICGDADKLLFVGLMSSGPNIVAVDWFLSSFWKDLKMRFPKLTLRIAGKGMSEENKTRWSQYEGVEILGFVDDLAALYRDSLALVMPMRIGMGSCIKLVESLAYGRCVIATQQGLRGIPDACRIPENGMLPFDDFDSLAAAIEKLRTGDRVALQRGGVAYVREHNSQECVNRILAEELRV